MIKYVLTPNGVINRETGMTIKEGLASQFWQEYLAWVDEGNTPVPISPGTDYVLAGDEWVFDQTIQDARTLTEKKIALKEKLLELFEFMFALFIVLRDEGVNKQGKIEVSQFDPDLIVKAQVWKGLLDDIDALS